MVLFLVFFYHGSVSHFHIPTNKYVVYSVLICNNYLSELKYTREMEERLA